MLEIGKIYKDGFGGKAFIATSYAVDKDRYPFSGTHIAVDGSNSIRTYTEKGLFNLSPSACTKLNLIIEDQTGILGTEDCNTNFNSLEKLFLWLAAGNKVIGNPLTPAIDLAHFAISPAHVAFGNWKKYIEPVKPRWEDNLDNVQPLCWVSNAEKDRRKLVAIITSIDYSSCPYNTLQSEAYTYATPLTKEELLSHYIGETYE
jgi:hypothetical protein